jgi:hypothetical protein
MVNEFKCWSKSISRRTVWVFKVLGQNPFLEESLLNLHLNKVYLNEFHASFINKSNIVLVVLVIIIFRSLV